MFTFSPQTNLITKPKNINYIRDPKGLGERVKNKRLEKEMTQEAAGIEIGVTRSGLSDWENNVTEPTIQFYPAIIKYLGYTPFDFDLQTLGGRIKQYRFIHGFSQEVLGKRLGIGPATIHRAEQGKGVINRKTKKLLGSVIDLRELPFE